jgi:ABC-type amino acid transport substrate-binding protein
MQKYFNYIIGIIAVVAIIMSLTTKNATQISVADRMVSSNEVRIGYIIYPPLLYKDIETGKLSGVSYDIVEAAAKKLSLRTNWVEEVGWGTALEGLKTNRYDMLGTQMWPNSARAREGTFTMGPIINEIYPVVRVDDRRFDDDLSVINNKKYIVGGIDGEASQTIAQENYPEATKNYLPQLTSYAESFLNIAEGKTDIAFTDVSAVNTFIENNPGKIRIIADKPIRKFENSFVFKRGEDSAVFMWNIALQELVNEGTIEKILKNYNVENDFAINKR